MQNIKFLSFIGIDKPVFYFLLSKGFNFVAAPVTIYFVTTFLNPVEQGYYYTFYSLLGISIFFELGLGTVITQFASHEYSNLSWLNEKELSGENYSLSRVISLTKKSMKWYSIISGLLVIFLSYSGYVFFRTKQESYNISFIIPWIILVFFFGLNTSFIPLLSVLEGCGKIAEVQQLRAFQSVVGVIAAWICFVSGGKLLVVPVEFISYFSILCLWLFLRYKSFLKQVLMHNSDKGVHISWFREIFPMQWKIAVSWISNYFTSYLFVPLLFAYQGPIEAGRMGVSTKVSGIIYTLSMAWISTKVPYYGALVSKKEHNKLKSLAIKGTTQAVFMGIIFSLMALLLLSVIENFVPRYRGRILPLCFVGILCGASILNVITSSIACYLRAHKEEPLMIVSIIVAICSALVSFYTSIYHNANIMSLGYLLVIMFISVPLHYYVFVKKQREWYDK